MCCAASPFSPDSPRFPDSPLTTHPVNCVLDALRAHRLLACRFFRAALFVVLSLLLWWTLKTGGSVLSFIFGTSARRASTAVVNPFVRIAASRVAVPPVACALPAAVHPCLRTSVVVVSNGTPCLRAAVGAVWWLALPARACAGVCMVSERACRSIVRVNAQPRLYVELARVCMSVTPLPSIHSPCPSIALCLPLPLGASR